MAETPQPVVNTPLGSVAPGAPEHPIADSQKDEELLKQELARLTPPNEKLQELADKSPPPPEWVDQDEEPPF